MNNEDHRNTGLNREPLLPSRFFQGVL
jgi:hypothetical protein